MKKIINTILIFVFLQFLVSSCLITEVDQSTEVKQGDTFTTTITVSDQTADTTPHPGAVAVLVPSDWEFASGTYDSQVGTGNFIADTNEIPVYGKIDSVLPPPDNMKWARLITDSAYTNAANIVHEATINFSVGSMKGQFNIGYMVTKNSPELLYTLNTQDADNDKAWSDTSMVHPVSVNMSTDVEDNELSVSYVLDQNYPNPFNPTTSISFTLPKSENVKITVYNSLGNEIAVLGNERYSSGKNTLQFDAGNFASGVYYYKIETNSFVQTKKMLLLK